MSIPFGDESHQAIGQKTAVREVTNLKSLALQDTEPLLYLIHPGAMDRQEVADKAGMKRQPVLSLLAMMDTRIIEHKEDASDRGRKLLIQLGEQSEELFLPLAHGCLSCDLA